MSESTVDTVTLDRATYTRILEALRSFADASSPLDLARASERCGLLLIDLGARSDDQAAAMSGSDSSKPAERSGVELEAERLRCALYECDAVSQEAGNTIDSVCALVLMSLERPVAGYGLRPGRENGHLLSIVHALEAIQYTVSGSRDSINAQAEKLGCDYVNPRFMARNDSGRTA